MDKMGRLVKQDFQKADEIEKGNPFDRFVSMKDGWFYEILPFDHVLLDIDGSKAVVKTALATSFSSPVACA